MVWLQAPDNWLISKHLLNAPHGVEAETRETRQVDFEVQAPQDAGGVTTIQGYALYYICEKQNGTCMYLRQDFTIPIKVR